MMHGRASKTTLAVATFLSAAAIASPSAFAAAAPTHTIEQPTRVEQLALDGTRIFWSSDNVVYQHELTTGLTNTALVLPSGYFVSRLIADNGTAGIEATLSVGIRTKTIVYRIDSENPSPRRVAATTLKEGRRYTCGKISQLGDVSPDRMVVLITHKIRQRHPRCHNRRNGTEIFIRGMRSNNKIGQYVYYDSFRLKKYPFFSKNWGFIASVDVERTDAAIGGNSIQYTRHSWSERVDEIQYHDPDDPQPIIYFPDLSAGGKLIASAFNFVSNKSDTARFFIGQRRFKPGSKQVWEDQADPNPDGFVAGGSYTDSMRFCGEQVLGLSINERQTVLSAALMTIVWPWTNAPPFHPNSFMFWAAEIANGSMRESAHQLANVACDELRVVDAINDSTSGRSTITVRNIADFAAGPWPVLP